MSTNLQVGMLLISRIYVASHPNSFIFCAGDFNVPDIEWTSHSITTHRYPVDINQSILKMVDDCYFSQLVNSPTRNKNILDIIFTNRPSFINYCTVLVIMKLFWPLSWHKLLTRKEMNTGVTYGTELISKRCVRVYCMVLWAFFYQYPSWMSMV